MRTAPSVTVNSRYVMLIMMNGHSALSSLLDPADAFPPASAFAEEEDGAFASSPTGAILSAPRGMTRPPLEKGIFVELLTQWAPPSAQSGSLHCSSKPALTD